MLPGNATIFNGNIGTLDFFKVFNNWLVYQRAVFVCHYQNNIIITNIIFDKN